MKARKTAIGSPGVIIPGFVVSALLFAIATTGLAENDHAVVVSESQTLQQIVEHELQSSRYAKQIATYNGYDADTSVVPIGATIKIPKPYLQQRDFGQVVFAKGDVVHAQQNLVVNPPAKGAQVFKGDTFSTGEDGFVSLKFSSGSVVNVQPQSRVSVKDIACADETVSCLIALNAEQGEIESSVTPRPEGQPPVEFTVTTPFLSAAVRGTAFYVNVEEGADRIGVTHGLVATDVNGSANELPKGKGLLAEASVEPELVDLLEAPEIMLSESAAIYSSEDTIRWRAMQAAQRYRLTIAQDDALTSPLLVDDLQETKLLLAEPLTPGQYFLSVAGIDSKKFLGLPATMQFNIAEIVDEENVDLQVTRVNGTVNVAPIEYNGTVELVISNDLNDPTELQRITGTLTDGLSLELSESQDWVIRARKVISPTSVSVYSDHYLLEAGE